MRLVRFQSLANEEDLCRAIRTITTGEFWCSKLWNMNDPMEGVYLTAYENNLERIFRGKKKYVICSFSDNNMKKAVKKPLFWGYYANGFKGIAIEIEVEAGEMNEVHYGEIVDIDETILKYDQVNENSMDDDKLIKNIITTKLDFWKNEDEWRFLTDSDVAGYHKIGKIKRVYIGYPYRNVRNLASIVTDSNNLTNHIGSIQTIKTICDCLRIESEYASMDNHGKVKLSNTRVRSVV